MKAKKEFFQSLIELSRSLPKARRKVVRFITDHYQEAVFLTAREIGKRCNVSEPTVNRTARDAGYPGFPEFMRNLKEIVHAELSGEGRYQLASRERLRDGESYLEQLVRAEKSNLEELKKTDTKKLSEFSALLAKSTQVLLCTDRIGIPLAQYLYYGLLKIRDRVDFLKGITSTSFDRTALSPADSFIVIISLGRYSRALCEYTEWAGTTGRKIGIITDSPLSPLLEKETLHLIAPVEVESFLGTLSAPTCLAAALLEETSHIKEEEVMKRLKVLEETALERDHYIE